MKTEKALKAEENLRRLLGPERWSQPFPAVPEVRMETKERLVAWDALFLPKEEAAQLIRDAERKQMEKLYTTNIWRGTKLYCLYYRFPAWDKTEEYALLVYSSERDRNRRMAEWQGKDKPELRPFEIELPLPANIEELTGVKVP